MRITNDDTFNIEQVSGEQPHIFHGTAAPSAIHRFTSKPIGTQYVRHIADGHIELYLKTMDNNLASDYRCIQGVISQRIAIADFTDGGGASGTLVLDNAIPVGAIVDPISIMDVTGFAGDTHCYILVGESSGGDTDRYMTGATVNVFATADAINAGVPSGVRHHTASKSILVTLTSNTDIGLVITDGAGAATISVPYHF